MSGTTPPLVTTTAPPSLDQLIHWTAHAMRPAPDAADERRMLASVFYAASVVACYPEQLPAFLDDVGDALDRVFARRRAARNAPKKTQTATAKAAARGAHGARRRCAMNEAHDALASARKLVLGVQRARRHAAACLCIGFANDYGNIEEVIHELIGQDPWEPLTEEVLGGEMTDEQIDGLTTFLHHYEDAPLQLGIAIGLTLQPSGFDQLVRAVEAEIPAEGAAAAVLAEGPGGAR
jgi:hypothetical protein